MLLSRRLALTGLLSLPLARPARAANVGEVAPELEGLENWINAAAPQSMAALRGKVVLVDFWTFGCSNCINTLPWLVKWHAEMASKGLVILGIHTPEFPFERDLDALNHAVGQYGIQYPVAQDNRYRSWMAFGTRYWPTSVLVDRDGRIVKYHEGDRGLKEFGAEVAALVGA